MKSPFALAPLAILVAAVFLSGTSAPAQTARQTGQSEQKNNYIMGGASAAVGTGLMVKYCHLANTTPDTVSKMMCYALGPGLIMEGAQNIMQGHGRSASIDPLTQQNVPSGNQVPCEQDPTNPFCIHSQTTDGPNYGSNPTGKAGSAKITSQLLNSVPAPVAEVLRQAQDVAQKYGLDINDPASVEAFKAKAASSKSNGGAGDSGSAGGLSASSLSPEVQAQIDKAKNDFLKKMDATTSDVQFNETGKSNAFNSHRGSNGSSLNMNSLLDVLKDKNDRNPAASDTLSKNFNGESIGVATDDIFKQISRRYQKKIESKTFNPK